MHYILTTFIFTHTASLYCIWYFVWKVLFLFYYVFGTNKYSCSSWTTVQDKPYHSPQ